jgi:hypothetical protein
MAINAAWKTFTDPESHVREMTHEQRIEFWAMAWSYYRSYMFSRRNGEKLELLSCSARDVQAHPADL